MLYSQLSDIGSSTECRDKSFYYLCQEVIVLCPQNCLIAPNKYKDCSRMSAETIFYPIHINEESNVLQLLMLYWLVLPEP